METTRVRVDVELGPDGHPRAAEAEARLSRSAEVLWAAIVDVDGYPGRVPMIHRVRRTGDRVTVQLRFKIALFSVGFVFVEDERAEEGRALELRWVSGEPRGLHLRFALEPEGPGSCRVKTYAALDVSSLGWLVKVFLRHHPEIALGVVPGVALNLIDAMRRSVGAQLLPPRPPGMVRVARAADARAIAEVQVAAWRAAYQGLMPAEKIAAFTVEMRAERWAAILAEEHPDRVTSVFERDGRVVGFASVGPSRDVPDLGEVWALYAHPDAWRTGAGRALLEDGLAFLARHGWARSMLWVLEGNVRAIRFYEAAGGGLDLPEVAGPAGLPAGRRAPGPGRASAPAHEQVTRFRT